MAYHRYHGVKTRIVRIFNTYGPRMRLNDGRVLPNFMSQVLRGEPITVYGKGDQTRSFCYVTDLVEGIYRLLHADFPSRSTSATPPRSPCCSSPRRSSPWSRAPRARSSTRPAAGRPQAAEARHHPRPDAAGLEPHHRPRRRLERTLEYFRTVSEHRLFFFIPPLSLWERGRGVGAWHRRERLENRPIPRPIGSVPRPSPQPWHDENPGLFSPMRLDSDMRNCCANLFGA